MGVEDPVFTTLMVLALLLALGLFLFACGRVILRLSASISGADHPEMTPIVQRGHDRERQRLVIKNSSQAELGVMLEPWTDSENVEPGGAVVFEWPAAKEAEDIVIELGNQNFLSIWCPAGSELRREL